jgi:hypothetical protein
METICKIRGSHSSEDDSVVVLGCDAVWTQRQIPAFQKNVLSPSSEAWGITTTVLSLKGVTFRLNEQENKVNI